MTQVWAVPEFLENEDVVCFLCDLGRSEDGAGVEKVVVINLLRVDDEEDVYVVPRGELPQLGDDFVLQVKFVVAVGLV